MTRDFINGILEGRQVDPNLVDGARIQKLIDACQESHRRGCRVDV
jgi:hypothetical protein